MYFTKREIDYFIWCWGKFTPQPGEKWYKLLRKFKALKAASRGKSIEIGGVAEINFTRSELCLLLERCEKYHNRFSGDLDYLSRDERKHVSYVLDITSSVSRKLKPLVDKFDSESQKLNIQSSN